MQTLKSPKLEPIAVNAREASRLTGIPLRTLQEDAKAGRIPPARRRGSRYVFILSELREWVHGLPRIGGSNG